MTRPPIACEFCVELAGGSTANPLAEMLPPGHPYLLHHDHVTGTIPSIGALAAGHVLVCPRQHVGAVASLNGLDYRSLQMAVARTRVQLELVYGSAVAVFEHGSGALSSAGACADHAHVHLIPLHDPKQLRALTDHLPWRQLGGRDLQQTATRYVKRNGYLYLDDSQHRWLCDGRYVRSQELRRAASQLLGRPDEWDWAVCPRPDLVEQTINDLHRFASPARLAPCRPQSNGSAVENGNHHNYEVAHAPTYRNPV